MRLSRLARSVFVLACCTVPVLAQNWLSVGLKGGVPLTDAFADRTFTNQIFGSFTFGSALPLSQSTRVYGGSREFVLGPTVEVRLPLGLGIEADALYRPMEAKSQTRTTLLLGGSIGPVFSNTVDTWEFPVLAKYRMPVPVMKPYIDAGPSFRPVSASLAAHMSGAGVVAGIGVEMRVGPLRIAPEVRYTHWGSDGTYTSLYHAVSYSNQVEFLAGLSAAPGNSMAKSHSHSGWTKYVALGVKGGLPISNTIIGGEFARVTTPSIRCGTFDSTNCTPLAPIVKTYSAARDYLIGPSVEIYLPLRLSLEADGLYGPLNAVLPSSAGLASFLLGAPPFQDHSFHAWQFPTVLKYKFRVPIVAPFFDAGPTVRVPSAPWDEYLSRVGFTAGVGGELPVWKLRVAPELRFVHWGNDSASTPMFYASRRNQAQFLVGFSY